MGLKEVRGIPLGAHDRKSSRRARPLSFDRDFLPRSELAGSPEQARTAQEAVALWWTQAVMENTQRYIYDKINEARRNNAGNPYVQIHVPDFFSLASRIARISDERSLTRLETFAVPERRATAELIDAANGAQVPTYLLPEQGFTVIADNGVVYGQIGDKPISKVWPPVATQ